MRTAVLTLLISFGMIRVASADRPPREDTVLDEVSLGGGMLFSGGGYVEQRFSRSRGRSGINNGLRLFVGSQDSAQFLDVEATLGNLMRFGRFDFNISIGISVTEFARLLRTLAYETESNDLPFGAMGSFEMGYRVLDLPNGIVVRSVTSLQGHQHSSDSDPTRLVRPPDGFSVSLGLSFGYERATN